MVDGAITGQLFLSWIEQHLIQELKPGDVVITDNLNSHKVKGVVEAVESVEAKVLYLPPYRPDFNPIELAFFKAQATDSNRKTTNLRRALEHLWNHLQKLLRIRIQKLLRALRIPLH